jgi:ankyrin repeat protein
MKPLALILGFLLQQPSVPLPAALLPPPPVPAELVLAASNGQVLEIRGFSQNPGFAQKDEMGRTALVVAGEKGQKAAFAELIAVMRERVSKEVARTVAKEHYDVTGLMRAVQERNFFFSAANAEGLTPLMYASRYGWADLVEVLLADGVDPSPVDNDGRSAIQHALDAGHPEIVDLLKKPGD